MNILVFFIFCALFVCFICIEKHGLKVYTREPHSFTPMLEEGMKGAAPRSLTLGSDLAKNLNEIGKFSQKDAKVS